MSVEREMSLAEWCAKLPSLHLVNQELSTLNTQLAALAEQNEKMRKVLLRLACLGNGDQYGNSIGNCIAQEALSLPDLASPVLNKYRAEGMRMAAEICEHISDEYREREGRRYPELKTDAESGASDCESSIRAQAAELEKQQ